MSTELARLEQDETKAIIAATLAADPFALAPIHADSGHSQNQMTVPYVGFRGHKTKDKDKGLETAGIEPLEFYLHSVAPIKLKPFTIHLLPGVATFHTTLDSKGAMQGAAFEDPGGDFREHVFGVVAVVLGGGAFIPATISLRSGMTAALKKTKALILGDAANPDLWARLSPKHAKSAAVKFPGGRFQTRIWVTEEQPKGDPDGEPYNLGNSLVNPTPEDEVLALNKWMVDDLPRIKAVMAYHNVKVAQIRNKALEQESN